MDLPKDPWMDIKWIYKLYDVRAMYTPLRHGYDTTEELTWQAGHSVGAKQAYLGVQDAARK